MIDEGPSPAVGNGGADAPAALLVFKTLVDPYVGRVNLFKVLSVAPALAEAMRRIHNGESVSALFHPA